MIALLGSGLSRRVAPEDPSSEMLGKRSEDIASTQVVTPKVLQDRVI